MQLIYQSIKTGTLLFVNEGVACETCAASSIFPSQPSCLAYSNNCTMRTKGLDVVGRSIDEPALPTSLHKVRPVQVDCHGGRSQRSQ